MADEPKIGGEVAAQPGQASAAQPTPAPTIDPAEFKRLQERVRGSDQLVSAARQFGLEKVEAVNQWGPVIKTLSEKGVRPNELVRAFQAQAEPGQTGEEAVANVEEALDRRLTAAEKRFIQKRAEEDHQRAVSSEFSEFTPEKIKGALGEGVPDEVIELFRYAALGRYAFDPARATYPQDHPLAGTLAPMGQDGLGKLREWMGSAKSAVTANKAIAAAKIGQAAKAGSAASQSTPKNQPPSTGGTQEPAEDEDARALAFLASQRARRSGSV